MSRERLIMVLKILSEETDEENGMTLRQIKDSLTRRSDALWDDQRIRSDLALIEGLCDEGELPYRLEKIAGPHNAYSYRFYRSGFGLNEARMVFDSVSTSRFLSDGQKRELLSEMEGFLSKREVAALKQRVESAPSLMKNESLPGNLKRIYGAIDRQRCLSFDYCKYGVDGKRHLDRQYSGIRPIKVLWGESHYYLLAVNPKHGQERRYRIDRMDALREDDSPWFSVDRVEFSYGQFEMFGSQERCVATLRIHPRLVDMVLEKLGPSVHCRPDDHPDWARVWAEVEISDGFYRWVLQQGDKMEVLKPENVRQEVKARIEKILESYR